MFSRDKRLQGFSQNLGSFVHGLRPVTILKRKNPLEAVDEVVYHVRTQKDFLGPLFKKLGNHSSFYEWNLGSNRLQKWRKLVLTSFRSLRELRASFPFISVAERQRLKLGMLEEKDTNCSRRL